jgi:hypothetical protein
VFLFFCAMSRFLAAIIPDRPGIEDLAVLPEIPD